MTTEQIHKQIEQEYMEFNNSLYSGNPALPKDLISRFRTAIFKLSPEIHRIPTKAIEKIVNKKVKDLTNIDVPIILNVISRCPFCDLYKDFEEALIKNEEIEELKISINLTISEINRQSDIKRNNLLSLSGGGNGKIKTLAQA